MWALQAFPLRWGARRRTMRQVVDAEGTTRMKKILIVLILAAIGVAVFKKVRAEA